MKSYFCGGLVELVAEILRQPFGVPKEVVGFHGLVQRCMAF